MWRQSRLLDLKLWQTARQSAEQTWQGGACTFTLRQKHTSAGKVRIRSLEQELAKLKATSLEQLQEQVKHKAEAESSSNNQPQLDLRKLALQAFREHNTSLPLVKGQLLKGTVIRVDRRTVWLDVGLAKHAKFFRSQVQVSQVKQTTSTEQRSGPNDIHVGDVLHVTLETSETPFGDPVVILDPPRDADHFNMARNELRAALESGEPVMGRLLNPLIGGYAVGVGGIVGFCSFKNCSLPVASRLGVLQPFRVMAFRDMPFNLVLQDAQVGARRNMEARPNTYTTTPANTSRPQADK